MIDAATLAGQFLLAMPGMGDPRFHRAVIAMMVHDSEGALGIGLGRVRPGLGLHELLDDLDIDPGQAPDCLVLDDGPVEPQRGFVLHTPDWDGPDTILSGELCALSASLEVLRAIAEGRGPSRFLVALGYAGWGEGQLDAELQRHGWQVATAQYCSIPRRKTAGPLVGKVWGSIRRCCPGRPGEPEHLKALPRWGRVGMGVQHWRRVPTSNPSPLGRGALLQL